MRGDVVAPECEAAREAMSAHLDGEDSPLSAAWLTAHLVECAPCRGWYGAAAEIRRRSRLALVPDVPDLTGRILAAAVAAVQPPDPMGIRRDRRLLFARSLLGLAALAQLWFALPVLLFARDLDVSEHPAHELGSFDTALALGFLIVVWRPRLARGMRPLVGVIAALLVVTAIVDLVHGGRTTLGDEAPHLIAAIGFVLMCLIPQSPQQQAAVAVASPQPAPGNTETGPSRLLTPDAEATPSIDVDNATADRATA